MVGLRSNGSPRAKVAYEAIPLWGPQGVVVCLRQEYWHELVHQTKDIHFVASRFVQVRRQSLAACRRTSCLLEEHQSSRVRPGIDQTQPSCRALFGSVPLTFYEIGSYCLPLIKKRCSFKHNPKNLVEQIETSSYCFGLIDSNLDINIEISASYSRFGVIAMPSCCSSRKQSQLKFDLGPLRGNRADPCGEVGSLEHSTT